MYRFKYAATALLVLVGILFADTTWVEVGNAHRMNAVPFWGQTYNAFRSQSLYYQSEIDQPGNIIAIGLCSPPTAPAAYYNVSVRLCHTTLDNLSTRFDSNYVGNTPEKVFEAETLLVGTGQSQAWYYFSSAWDYNNEDNLIVEITWRGDAGTNISFYRNPLGHDYRRLFAYDDTASFGFRDTVNGNYIRFGFAPTGIAGPHRLPPAGSSPTYVSNLLRLPGHEPAELVDVTGRTAAYLKPGENEIRHLAPGVYYVRFRNRGTEKVIIRR